MLVYMGKQRKIVGKIVRTLLVGLVVFIAAGNLMILGANVLLRATVDSPAAPKLPGIENIAAVDQHLWRGGAPNATGYKALARNGVGTIVDLRAERDLQVDEQLLRRLGLKRIHIPMRDGQAPTPDQVERFLSVMQASKKRVFVHCGAGVGRTGTMAASYLVETGKAESSEALGRNLAVGPPSLEQITYVAGLSGEDVSSPPAAITFMSRVIDGPRRMWVNITHAYQD